MESEVKKDLILKVKERLEDHKGVAFNFFDLIRFFKISDTLLIRIIGILQRDYNLPLRWV